MYAPTTTSVDEAIASLFPSEVPAPSVDEAIASLAPVEMPTQSSSFCTELEYSIEGIRFTSGHYCTIDPFAFDPAGHRDHEDFQEKMSEISSALRLPGDAGSCSNSSSAIASAGHSTVASTPPGQPSAQQQPSSSTSTSSQSENPAAPRRKLRAWTLAEHKRFTAALAELRTEETEAVDANGKRTKGLGPGIASVIAQRIGTRNAAQVRSHAQKYFTRIRKEMGIR